jgi:hypothetical protein
MPPQPTGRGRRRIYCSERCRVIAFRRRQTGAEVDLEAVDGCQVDFEIPMPEVTNPDEDLAQTLGTLLYCKGRLAQIAPKIDARLAWRCTKMSDHIEAGLDEYFRP